MYLHTPSVLDLQQLKAMSEFILGRTETLWYVFIMDITVVSIQHLALFMPLPVLIKPNWLKVLSVIALQCYFLILLPTCP